jgi:hypothetical protein
MTDSSSTGSATTSPAGSNGQTKTAQPSATNTSNQQNSASAAMASYTSTPAAGSTQTPTSQQTSGSDASYYNEYGMQGSTNAEYASYASDYSAEAAYEAAVAKSAAQAASQAEETAAVRVILQAQRATEATATENTTPQQAAPAETPSAGPAVASNGPVIAAVVHRTNETGAIPAFHHIAEASDGPTELALDDGASKTLDASSDRRAELHSAATDEEAGVVPDAGVLIAGAVPFNVEELERGVGRFFDYLDDQGWNWFKEIRVVSLGSLLAGGVAATAAFELARRSARARLQGPAGSLAGSDDPWLPDSDSSLQVTEEP